MPTAYPAAFDTLTNPAPTDALNAPSHADQHANANDAIEAIEHILGVSPQGVEATVSARIAAIEGAPSGGGIAILAAIDRWTGISPQFTATGAFVMVTGTGVLMSQPGPGGTVDQAGTVLRLRDNAGAVVTESPAWSVYVVNSEDYSILLSRTHIFATTPGTVYDVQFFVGMSNGTTGSVEQFGGGVIG